MIYCECGETWCLLCGWRLMCLCACAALCWRGCCFSIPSLRSSHAHTHTTPHKRCRFRNTRTKRGKRREGTCKGFDAIVHFSTGLVPPFFPRGFSYFFFQWWWLMVQERTRERESSGEKAALCRAHLWERRLRGVGASKNPSNAWATKVGDDVA